MKRRIKMKTGNTDSLEQIMQETYNGACDLILDTQKTINELKSAAKPDDVQELGIVAKETTSALKIKENAIKIKLELVKIQADIIKHNGDLREGIAEYSKGEASVDDFKSIRELIKNKGIEEDPDKEKTYVL